MNPLLSHAKQNKTKDNVANFIFISKKLLRQEKFRILPMAICLLLHLSIIEKVSRHHHLL